MILANWPRRASEEPHSSMERLDFLRRAILAASQAAVSMVVHLEGDGLEARLWIVSVRPTTRPESAKAGSDYFLGEF
jgi:hypothetical protein